MFPGRAPEGFVALTGYVGGGRQPELGCLPERDLIDLVKEEFRDLLGAKGEPAVAKVRHWPQGIPQYRLGHGDKVAALATASDRSPGLFLTGNYFQGPAVATCLELGLDTASDVDGYLTNESNTEQNDAAFG
jgi:oxygen-dependent protoporphyrinogen oxidase